MKNKNSIDILNDLIENILRPAALKYIKGDRYLRSNIIDIIEDTIRELIKNEDKLLAHPNQKSYALSVMKDLIMEFKNKRKKKKEKEKKIKFET